MIQKQAPHTLQNSAFFQNYEQKTKQNWWTNWVSRLCPPLMKTFKSNCDGAEHPWCFGREMYYLKFYFKHPRKSRKLFKVGIALYKYKTYTCNCALFVHASFVKLEFWVSVLLYSLHSFTFSSYQRIIVTKSNTLKFGNGHVKLTFYANVISPCGFIIFNKMPCWACANGYFWGLIT